MSIRMLAFALLAGASLAYAAPPKKKADPPPTQDAADSIDVDALARAKDANGAPPADDATPPAESAAPAPPSASVPNESAPVEAAASQAPAAATPEATPEASASANAPAANAAADATIDATKPPPPDEAARRLAASCTSRASSLLDDAQKSDFANATRDFDAKMRSEMPVPKFKQQWESLGQFGKLVARGQSHLGTGEGYTLVMIPLIFETNTLIAQIACGSDGRIAGFHVTEAPKPKPGF